jgi:hypothetical protein
MNLLLGGRIMLKQEFSEALKIAESHEDLSKEEIHHFDGFALDGFGTVACTIRQLARLIRWQCFYFSGGIDADALNEIVHYGRKRFYLLFQS